MAAPTAVRLATFEDLLALEDPDRVEIIEGALVQKAMPSHRPRRRPCRPAHLAPGGVVSPQRVQRCCARAEVLAPHRRGEHDPIQRARARRDDPDDLDVRIGERPDHACFERAPRDGTRQHDRDCLGLVTHLTLQGRPALEAEACQIK